MWNLVHFGMGRLKKSSHIFCEKIIAPALIVFTLTTDYNTGHLKLERFVLNKWSYKSK